MHVLDQQGFKIKVGAAYHFSFGQGDRTTLVVESIDDDGLINTYDVFFKMKVEIKNGDWLWRPLKHTWSAWPQDSETVISYAGESALDLTP
jgi:hypothetical protein